MARSSQKRILILGGTAEANALAAALAGRGDVTAILSYAGRTENPKAPPIPYRVGGFGGIKGLHSYLMDNAIDALIDATHPFAAQMSAHAVAAAEVTGVPLIALERPAWTAEPGDIWTEVDILEQAADALGDTPRKVFLAIGRLHLAAFAAKPQHAYLVRLVDPPREALPLRHVEVLIGRGPFKTADDLAMMRDRGIEAVVAKNAGGPASYAKIEAARLLRIPVILQRRPAVPPRETVETVEATLAWLAGL